MKKIFVITGWVYLLSVLLISCKKDEEKGPLSPLASASNDYYIKYTIDGVSDSASCVNYNNFCYFANQASNNSGDSAACPSFSYVGTGSTGICIKTPNYDFVNLFIVAPCDSSLMSQDLVGKKNIIEDGLGLPLVYPFSKVFQVQFKFSNNTQCYKSILDTSIATYYNEITEVSYKGRTTANVPYFSVRGKFTCRMVDCNNAGNIKI
ncbi:MAG: hypothetical protein K0S44_3152, partial [Bacteroidetes bacterium]|nr:hypothetical protein [Bacteroidota bacterium]